MNKNVKINNPTLVDAWRQSNPHIVQFWWAVDHAVTEAVKYKHTTTEYGLTFSCRSGILFITLPSGRNLVYVKPRAMRRFNNDNVLTLCAYLSILYLNGGVLYGNN